MEYMLLRDGSVRVYPNGISNAVAVFEELIAQGGVAYYWEANSDKGLWYRIDTYTHAVQADASGCLVFDDYDVPDVIKLTCMLE